MSQLAWAFHHIGILTPNLAKAGEAYLHLGYRASEIFSDPIQQANIQLFERSGHPMIEIIQPHGPTGPAAGFLQRIRCGAYHTCYEVGALEDAMANLRPRGFVPTAKPVPAVAFGGRRVVFLWGRFSGLLELVEAAPAVEPGTV